MSEGLGPIEGMTAVPVDFRLRVSTRSPKGPGLRKS